MSTARADIDSSSYNHQTLSPKPKYTINPYLGAFAWYLTRPMTYIISPLPVIGTIIGMLMKRLLKGGCSINPYKPYKTPENPEKTLKRKEAYPSWVHIILS